MTNVTVSVERNESHPKGEAHKTLGTFEWVQLTYRSLRVSPNGDTELATFTPEGYWETSDGDTWSDVIIG